jgi:hypothetical protein
MVAVAVIPRNSSRRAGGRWPSCETGYRLPRCLALDDDDDDDELQQAWISEQQQREQRDPAGGAQATSSSCCTRAKIERQ